MAFLFRSRSGHLSSSLDLSKSEGRDLIPILEFMVLAQMLIASFVDVDAVGVMAAGLAMAIILTGLHIRKGPFATHTADTELDTVLLEF